MKTFNFQFIPNKKIYFIISIAIILAGLICFFAFGGLTLDLDFQGGTAVRVEMGKDFDDEAVKNFVEKEIGNSATVQKSGTEAYIKTLELDTEKRDNLVEAIKAEYGVDQNAILEVNNVTASASTKLISDSMKAVGWAMLVMLIYITFRFDLLSGIAAVVGLVHTVVIMIAVYVMFKIPVNSSFIAAVLTIVGYSINDTIVVFDRIRDNVKTMRRDPFEIVANISLNETLRRTIYTGVTTLISISLLYIMGVDSIKEFALPIIIGILVGTYASICIATPIWVILRNNIRIKARR